MNVSIVTAFYEGSHYLDNYIKTIVDNAYNLPENCQLTAVLVNDSPWVELEEIDLTEAIRRCSLDEYHIDVTCQKLVFKLIVNETNSGIHQSRVNGLLSADSQYVTFLDQDDILREDAIATMLKEADDISSVLVCNAALQQADGDCLSLYHSSFGKKKLSSFKTYLKVGTQIISPGHTLVKTEDIPEAWKTYICHKNGSDDYFLWLLMLEEGLRFKYVDETLYTHVYTSKNLSSDTKVTDQSNFEFINFMKQENLMKASHINTLETMLKYKADFREASKPGKILLSLRHLDICLTNVMFKMFSRTPYGFNR